MADLTRNDGRRRAWTDPASLGTTLLVLLLDAYGPEALGWDPMTVHHEVQDDFGVTLPGPNLDRLMAAVAVVTTDRFRTSLPDFINLCNVLSGDSFDPSEFDPADAAECAWGVTEALLLDPPDDDDEEPFADDIVRYIGEACAAEGLLQPPDVLRIGLRDDARELVNRVQYEYGDDPVTFNAIWDMERSRVADINRVVKERLTLLVRQLEALPLENGDTADVVQRMMANLPKGTVTRAA